MTEARVSPRRLLYGLGERLEGLFATEALTLAEDSSLVGPLLRA
jgi:hypothetical protein